MIYIQLNMTDNFSSILAREPATNIAKQAYEHLSKFERGDVYFMQLFYLNLENGSATDRLLSLASECPSQHDGCINEYLSAISEVIDCREAVDNLSDLEKSHILLYHTRCAYLSRKSKLHPSNIQLILESGSSIDDILKNTG